MRPRKGRKEGERKEEKEGGREGGREGKKEGGREEMKTSSDMMSLPNFYNKNMGFHCDKQDCFAVPHFSSPHALPPPGMSVHNNQTVDMIAVSTFPSGRIFFHVNY